MATIRITLDTRAAAKDGSYPLKLAVAHHGKTAYIPLSVRLTAKQWDAKRQQVIGRPDRQSINAYLVDRLAVYGAAVRAVIMDGKHTRQLTATELRDLMVREVSPEDERKGFLDAFRAFMARKGNKRTHDIYEATLRKVRAYDKHADALALEDVDRAWLEDFFKWLAAASPSVNARNIHMRNIRAVFNFAIDEGLTSFYPFRRVKIKPEPTAKRNLAPEELLRIFRADVPPFAQGYLDAFALSFLLIGINVGDLLTLPPDALCNGRITYIRRKTHKLYTIKVEPEAAAIIERHKGKDFLLDFLDGHTSYRKTAERINRTLQRIAPGVTTYYARHSWATIAAALDIPKETIAQALGHSQTSVTDIYIEFDRRKVDEANRRVIDRVYYGK